MSATRFLRLDNLHRIHIVDPSGHTVAVQLLLIALGGALGSVCRYALSTAVQRVSSPFFPYGTFVVNVLGCLLFGVIMGAARQRFVLGPSERAFLLIGILGGFTTFSTFTYETFALVQDGEFVRALVNAGGQVVSGFVALWAGYVLVASL
jgi:fluoride exporter